MSSASLSVACTVPAAVWFSAALNVADDVNTGAAFASGAVMVAVSVSDSVPSEGSVARPVTVRVKVSSVPAVSAGIVTTGVALVSSSNVTPLVGPEVWLQL